MDLLIIALASSASWHIFLAAQKLKKNISGQSRIRERIVYRWLLSVKKMR
jgi:hypothetical protein